ncbi:MAG: D-glycero-beta-D-manno-heptose 1-phosphate adenylyltransferase, partial [Gemmatimonadota bacterium]|nr:D-glycero-beta-D-manno-heptose 1-phosphate adenylyltransferase [Gemmatimonadota bacterium]
DRTDLLGALSDELALEQSHKIADLDVLLRMVSEWRARGKRIVFTNGCFDLLHAGHVIYLEKARREGDCMVVGLNSDRSVRALKGESRPVIPQHERARVLAALSSVDAVILFDEDTPLKLIDAVRPDVIAKGSDYTEDQVVGGKEVKSWGGRVVLIPLVQGRSTTDILSRINSSDKTKS